MENKKITDLPDIGTPDPLDVLEIVDVSTNTSKKVLFSELGGGGGSQSLDEVLAVGNTTDLTAVFQSEFNRITVSSSNLLAESLEGENSVAFSNLGLQKFKTGFATDFIFQDPTGYGTISVPDVVDESEILALVSELPTNTSDLINDGEDGEHPYITLLDLPSNLILYPTTVASDVIGYVKLVTDIHDVDYDDPAVNVSTGSITTTNQLISSLITVPDLISGNPGVFNISTVGNIRRSAGSGTAEFYFNVYKRDSLGTETLIGVSNPTLPVNNGVYAEFSATAIWDDGVFTATDRIVLKFYGSRIAGGSNPTYEFQFGGLTPVRTLVPIPLSVVPNNPTLQQVLIAGNTATDLPAIFESEFSRTTVATGNIFIEEAGADNSSSYGATKIQRVKNAFETNVEYQDPTGIGTVLIPDVVDATEIVATREWVTANGSTPPSATETVAGIAEIATTAEVATGTDDTRIVTPLKLKAVTDLKANKQIIVIEADIPNNTILDANITGLTFSIPAGKSVDFLAIIPFTSAAITTGIGIGVKIITSVGANNNVLGSISTDTRLNTTTTGVIVNIVDLGANATVSYDSLSGISTAGVSNVVKIFGILKNLSTNTDATVQLVFRSEVAGSEVSIKRGSTLSIDTK
jgi:hypothetical protein